MELSEVYRYEIAFTSGNNTYTKKTIKSPYFLFIVIL